MTAPMAMTTITVAPHQAPYHIADRFEAEFDEHLRKLFQLADCDEAGA